MVKWSRRKFLGAAGLVGAGALGTRLGLPYWCAAGPPTPLSPELRAFVQARLGDLQMDKVWDLHVHLVGLGSGSSGAFVHPHMRSHLHPIQRLQFEIYTRAAGIRELEHADSQYVERLTQLARAANPSGRAVLLGFDMVVDQAGRERPDKGPFHTPNEYVHKVAATEDIFEAGLSIHPYRKDAVRRLELGAERGGRLVKWLPNAMGINPSSPLCQPFYDKLAELDMPLLTHTGGEKAVEAEEQGLGNPLHLRRALDSGVRVLAAHCASTGVDLDLEWPGAERDKDERESFDLFLRLMGERQYEGRLFGELSALTQINRCGRPLREMLMATEFHGRLVNGSDYPLPAIDPLFSTRLLKQRGYLSEADRRHCNALFRANPILFDLVLKRCVSVEENGRSYRFPARAFESGRLLEA